MNIIQRALCDLKDELITSGYFTVFYEYAELLTGNDDRFPQVYVGRGQYKKIYDFDVNGSGYIRMNGSVGAQIITDERFQMTSCSDSNPLHDISFPFRLVAAVPKSKMLDDAFSDHTLTLDLMGYISKKLPAIGNVASVHGRVQSYTTDRERIWNNEVHGIEKTVKFDLALIAIDFTITMRTSLDCIRQTCY